MKLSKEFVEGRLRPDPEAKTFQGRLYRGKLFNFPGGLKLLVCGVGDSSDLRLKYIARTLSNELDDCFNTWYFNTGNRAAQESFHYLDIVHNPILGFRRDEWMPVLNELQLMIDCALKSNYLCFGCNGNRHRGPSVFAMLLCVAGMQPDEAERTARSIFGWNFVLPSIRREIASLGYQFATEDERRKLQTLLGVEP